MPDENHSHSDHSSDVPDDEIAVNQPTAAAETNRDPDAQSAKLSERAVFTPPIDIYENENGLVLYADLPGVTADSLELQVQDNKLTLFGRVIQKMDPQATILHREYEEGDYLRSFILSDEVDHERITANLNNGVLKVVLPKAQRGPARNIPIRTD